MVKNKEPALFLASKEIVGLSWILVQLISSDFSYLHLFLAVGNEYGTIQGGWRGMLQEADSLADLHNLVADNLMTKDYPSIKAWQKENYHKSMMHFKETKELEEGFKKVVFYFSLSLKLDLD